MELRKLGAVHVKEHDFYAFITQRFSRARRSNHHFAWVRLLVNRQENTTQINHSAKRYDTAAALGHKQCHRARPMSDRLGNRGLEPERQAMTSMCGKDNQIRLLLLNLTHARPHRVSLRAHLGYTYRQLLENLRGKAPLFEHLPPCESFSDGRELGPIFPFAAARMHDDQLGLPYQ